jgi:hypothetical protein
MLMCPGPYGSPMSPMTTATGTTTVSISWASPDPSLQNGVITYYTVVLTDVTFGMPTRVFNTTIPTITFAGLEEYAQYTYEVAAATVGGLGPYSTAVQFTTSEASKSYIVCMYWCRVNC